MSNLCPNIENCPIYTGILKGKTMTIKAYRQLFCESKYIDCKRYLVKEATGVCPPDLLPNSHLPLDEIIKNFKLSRI